MIALTNLDIGITKTATITSAQTSARDKKIKRNTDVEIDISGNDLCGEFILKKGELIIKATSVKVKATDDFSDLTEAKAIFNTSISAGIGWKLIIINANGNSNEIDGFEIFE